MERIFSFEGGSSGSHYVESSLWKRLWTCRKADYLNECISGVNILCTNFKYLIMHPCLLFRPTNAQYIYIYILILVLTFVGPCILIYFYSKTNQMHNTSNLFYSGTTLYMFRTVFPSIIRSLTLYIQRQVYVIQVLWLLASGNDMELVPSRSP